MRESPVVAIVMGGESDRETMQRAAQTLEELSIPFEIVVLSAHRHPDRTRRYAREAAGRGIKVLIAGAGMAAHLPGALAAQTVLPVIGVPLASSPLGGFDALCSIVQMPAGVPVATVAIGGAGATNAAVLAAEILGLHDPKVGENLQRWRAEMGYEGCADGPGDQSRP